MKTTIFTILGFLALILGMIGVFLPILPTTPFVVAAAGCFATGSPRLNKWLSDTAYFGEFIENYRTKKGVKKAVKRRALLFLWIALAVSALLSRQIYVWVILLIVGIGVSLHIALLKEKK